MTEFLRPKGRLSFEHLGRRLARGPIREPTPEESRRLLEQWRDAAPLVAEAWAQIARFSPSPGRRPERMERGQLVDIVQRDGVQLYGLEGFGLDWRVTGAASDITKWRPSLRGGLIDG